MASELETSRVFSCPMNKSRPREATSDHISIYSYIVIVLRCNLVTTEKQVFPASRSPNTKQDSSKVSQRSKYEGLNLWLYDFKT